MNPTNTILEHSLSMRYIASSSPFGIRQTPRCMTDVTLTLVEKTLVLMPDVAVNASVSYLFNVLHMHTPQTPLPPLTPNQSLPVDVRVL